MVFGLREKMINRLRDYSFSVSEARQKTKYEERLKLLTLKQMLQVLPIVLSQVKVVNYFRKFIERNQTNFISCINQKNLLKSYTIA